MKIILISGTSSGIGLELARYFTQCGNQVIGLSRNIPLNENFKTIPCDITNLNDLKNAFKIIKTEYTKIDILINNAGKGMVGAIENAKETEIINLFQLNLIASVHLMQEVLPLMREQKSGKILNISSIGSEMGLPFRGFYSASKSALDKVTEAIRYEITPFNIQATSIHLGDIQTDIANNRLNSTVSIEYETTFKRVFQSMNQHVNQGKNPKEVAIFLDKLIHKKELKPHYYFGSFGQKSSILLKKFLPQTWFERIIKKYANL